MMVLLRRVVMVVVGAIARKLFFSNFAVSRSLRCIREGGFFARSRSNLGLCCVELYSREGQTSADAVQRDDGAQLRFFYFFVKTTSGSRSSHAFVVRFYIVSSGYS